MGHGHVATVWVEDYPAPMAGWSTGACAGQRMGGGVTTHPSPQPAEDLYRRVVSRPSNDLFEMVVCVLPSDLSTDQFEGRTQRTFPNVSLEDLDATVV